MDARELLNTLATLCQKVFQCGPVQLTPATTAADVDGWDSLSHVRLLLEVEKTFQIKVTVREAMKPANVGELAALIEHKVSQKYSSRSA